MAQGVRLQAYDNNGVSAVMPQPDAEVARAMRSREASVTRPGWIATAGRSDYSGIRGYGYRVLGL